MARYPFALFISAALAIVGFFAILDEPEPQAHPISGLWTRWPDHRGDHAPVRFYFFHPDGIGLYRYGKLGLNTTNSFDWRVDGDVLELTFRKTGEVVKTKFTIDEGGLILHDDPKEPFDKQVRYSFVPPPLVAPDLFEESSTGKPGEVPGRLWMDAKKFATGGMGFSLYQFRDAGIDGRAPGWFHYGDFDDWTTEALWYRWDARDGILEMTFPVRGDRAITSTKRNGDQFTLMIDPRGFWHVHTYKDAGPSFGALVFE
jgi:hypothetical protein